MAYHLVGQHRPASTAAAETTGCVSGRPLQRSGPQSQVFYAFPRTPSTCVEVEPHDMCPPCAPPPPASNRGANRADLPPIRRGVGSASRVGEVAEQRRESSDGTPPTRCARAATPKRQRYPWVLSYAPPWGWGLLSWLPRRTRARGAGPRRASPRPRRRRGSRGSSAAASERARRLGRTPRRPREPQHARCRIAARSARSASTTRWGVWRVRAGGAGRV